MSAIRNRWRKVRDAYPWQECARVFAERGWVYGFPVGCVPDEAELRATAESLFARVDNPKTVKAMGGRVLVYIDDGQPVILTEALDREEYFEKTASMRIDGDGTRAGGAS